MKKHFTFNGVDVTITNTGYGQYTISGEIDGKSYNAHTTDSVLVDDCDNEDEPDKMYEAQQRAYYILLDMRLADDSND